MYSASFNRRLRDDLFQAYFDARRHKRNTKAQLAFEMEMESKLMGLLEEIRQHTYRPSPAICFVVVEPVIREVFASQFRDRIIHHLLFNYLAPIFDPTFIADSYSCRKGKGTTYGIERLDHHIRSCSNNYKRMAFVLKLDIQGYFMSIDKLLLYNIICGKLKKYWAKHGTDENVPAMNPAFIDYLIKVVLFRDPTKNCIMRGDTSLFDKVPASKSLRKQPEGKGLPIGDLTSQLFSNILLSVLDDYIKRKRGIKHYGRYVDDFFIVHTSKSYLRGLVVDIRAFLRDELKLRLHPKKVYLQPYEHGVPFLGAFIKPHRIYTVPRSIASFHKTMEEVGFTCMPCDISLEDVDTVWSLLNSYLGYFSHFKAYKMIRHTMGNNVPVYCHFYFASGYSKAMPRSKYERMAS